MLIAHSLEPASHSVSSSLSATALLALSLSIPLSLPLSLSKIFFKKDIQGAGKDQHKELLLGRETETQGGREAYSSQCLLLYV